MYVSCANLEELPEADGVAWQEYSSSRTAGEPYSQPAWGRAIVSAYRLKGFLVVASGSGATAVQEERQRRANVASSGWSTAGGSGETNGVLPLVRLRHWFFGDSLVSLPFCDSGGGAWNDESAGLALVGKAQQVAAKLGVPTVEVRRTEPLSGLNDRTQPPDTEGYWFDGIQGGEGWRLMDQAAERKVRMLLPLPDDPDTLMRSFKSKLRSQIRKPSKEGLSVKIGGLDEIDGFYRVFVENMRDIGSPVHSIRFIEEVVRQYGSGARIFVVYQSDVAVASSVTLGFQGMLANPWASSLRRYSQLAPNMLLYWSMLEYACENGYRTFDFGRSTIGEGTYRFKEQWGAHPEPLYWYRFTRADVKSRGLDRDSGGMSRAVEIWKRLPLPVTRVLGPRIRRYISL